MTKYNIKVTVEEVEHGRGWRYQPMKSSWSNTIESDYTPDSISKNVLNYAKGKYKE